MQHCPGAVELYLRRGTAGDRKVDLAKLLFLGLCSRLPKEHRKRQHEITVCNTNSGHGAFLSSFWERISAFIDVSNAFIV
jgi:hypothetical protein